MEKFYQEVKMEIYFFENILYLIMNFVELKQKFHKRMIQVAFLKVHNVITGSVDGKIKF
jgi:hypothetical protein